MQINCDNQQNASINYTHKMTMNEKKKKIQRDERHSIKDNALLYQNFTVSHIAIES